MHAAVPFAIECCLHLDFEISRTLHDGANIMSSMHALAALSLGSKFGKHEQKNEDQFTDSFILLFNR
jgi:hypothetical protein